MIGVTIHRLTQIYTDWVKNTEDTENTELFLRALCASASSAPLRSSLAPFVSLATLALTSLRLCFLCAFAFILGDLKIRTIRGLFPRGWTVKPQFTGAPDGSCRI